MNQPLSLTAEKPPERPRPVFRPVPLPGKPVTRRFVIFTTRCGGALGIFGYCALTDPKKKSQFYLPWHPAGEKWEPVSVAQAAVSSELDIAMAMPLTINKGDEVEHFWSPTVSGPFRRKLNPVIEEVEHTAEIIPLSKSTINRFCEEDRQMIIGALQALTMIDGKTSLATGVLEGLDLTKKAPKRVKSPSKVLAKKPTARKPRAKASVA